MSESDNYRSAGRARSKAEFIVRMGTVVDEADESAGWLAMAKGLGIGEATWRATLIQEAGELLAIFAQSYNTAARCALLGRSRTIKAEADEGSRRVSR